MPIAPCRLLPLVAISLATTGCTTGPRVDDAGPEAGVAVYVGDEMVWRYHPDPTLVVDENPVPAARFPAVDIHCHWEPDADPRAMLAAMDAHNVHAAINLSGGWGERLDEMLERFHAAAPDRFIIFCNVDFDRIDDPDFGPWVMRFLRDAHARGVRGLKIFKNLGLTIRDDSGAIVPVDDPRLDPVWATCGELGMPVLIHTADPVAFFTPIDERNERWMQLRRHPDWSFYGPQFPDRATLFAQRDRMMRRHRGTTFICAHLASRAEDLTALGAWLDENPNAVVDISGRVGELGRRPYTARRFFLEHSDRILFGTDRFPGRPSQPRYRIYYRFLETADEFFDYYDHPFPPTGEWRIYGISLPNEVLRAVYRENADRVFGVRPVTTPMQWAILTASAFLLLGFVLRAKVRLLQILFVPASVIGGIVGLLLIQTAQRLPGWVGTDAAEPGAPGMIDAIGAWTGEIGGALRGWPGPLIAVVFAGLLLERPSRRLAPALRGAALAGIMVWIIVLGEIALGLAAGWLVIAPAFDVPPAFGQLLEAGFAGGHGTATALGAIFDEMLEFPEGLDLGLFMATIGLVYSILSGIVLVNIGVRRGWTRRGVRGAERELITGLEQRHDPVPAALARVRSEVIDPLAFQILIMAMAFLLGVVLQQTFILAARSLSPGDSLRYFQNVPLFLFTLLGGWMVRGLMTAFGIGDLIDGRSIQRMVAIAMEFLIVAAVASLRIEVVASYIGPLSLLCGLGFVWAVVCLVVISPHVLPREHWFELGLINYGMSTGTTAQGMMLLRIIDRDLDSGAAEDYALAAPLSAPFIGGGLLTMSLPLILSLDLVPIGGVVGGLVVVVIALFFVGRGLNRRR